MQNGRGKINGELIKILLIVVMAGFIGVKDVVVPLISGSTTKADPKLEDMVLLHNQKIVILETVVQRIDGLPESVAAIKEAVQDLKLSIDRLERKIDIHISK